MTRFVRPLGCAAACWILLGTAPANAQTVIVRGAPPAATLETIFDTTPVGTGTVGATGDGTVSFTSFPATGPEIAAAVHVDVCGTTFRVRLASRAIEPPLAGVGCERRSVPGYFVIRPETTLVIDVSIAVPTVRIAQGRPPEDWLRVGPIVTRSAREIPAGLIAFGGGGIGRIPDAIDLLCGNEPTCKREDTKLTYGAGAALWLGRFVGVEAGLIKPRPPLALADFEIDPFTSTVNARVLTLAALGGVPFGPVRFYGRVGANYHRATFRTVQVISGTTITVDGVQQTFPGTSQTFVYDTIGWGALYGGGVEGWVGRTTALFADMSFIRLKGQAADDQGGGTRTTDDLATAFLVGLKIQITGR